MVLTSGLKYVAKLTQDSPEAEFLYKETSSLKTLKIMSWNLNEIARSWIRLLESRVPGYTYIMNSISWYSI